MCKALKISDAKIASRKNLIIEYKKPIYDEGQVIKRGTYAFTAQRASP
jgi:hypothetical protein